jgi:hypothetical protein
MNIRFAGVAANAGMVSELRASNRRTSGKRGLCTGSSQVGNGSPSLACASPSGQADVRRQSPGYPRSGVTRLISLTGMTSKRAFAATLSVA